MANYQKTHLWIDNKQYEAVFTPGDSIDVFEFCGFKIGLFICYDVEFSEAVRVLAIQGAKVILVPTASSKDYKADFQRTVNFLLPAHCYENGVHIAYVNYSGDGFNGCSKIYDDKGQTLVMFGEKEEGIRNTVIMKNTAHSHFLENRRPELYRVLGREINIAKEFMCLQKKFLQEERK